MSNPIFRCGHPRTPENTKVSPSTGARCRTCRREYLASKRNGDAPIPPEQRAWNAMCEQGSARLLAEILRLNGLTAAPTSNLVNYDISGA